MKEWGIDILKDQLNRILTEGKEAFHEEKRVILSEGLSCSSYIQVDDTGARHDGRNGYCTHIGNELFAWFESTGTKSRINFLELLRQNRSDYNDIREYVKKRKVSGSTRSEEGRRCRDTFTSLKKTCKKLGVRFRDYLNDRVSGKNIIASLPILMKEKALLAC